jgi:outer membrane autotransporter protein
MASQHMSRRRLLAGTSLLALSLSSAPALACSPVTSGTIISAGTGCVDWTGGNLSITNMGSISGAATGVTIPGSNPAGTLTNSGTIVGSFTGIYNNGSIGTLTNSGAIAGNYTGIFNNGSIGALTNSGTISGDAAILSTGSIGTLTNSGAISGNYTAIDNSDSIGALTNSGTIAGYRAIKNNGTIGTLSNSGAITGNIIGIYNTGGIGALTNSRTISGNYGIYTTGSIGTLTNSSAISGNSLGIYNDTGTIGALTNSGTISGNSTGISNNGSIGTLTNESGGTISGGIGNNGSIGTLTNSGSIGGGNTGISLNNGMIGTLTNSGAISGNALGMYNATGTIGALTNSGTISGNYGIYTTGSIGTLTNSSAISGNTLGIYNDTGTIGVLTNSGTISGNSTGISNTGSIGTLTNSGTIAGNVAAIENSGTIGTLTNSGTISGNGYGIANGGTIDTLTNSGTISGPTAISNDSAGTLGPITNSGLIAGNIVNQASRALTINGGSGTIFGTLTGSSGSIGSADQGTITNTTSNLVFGSGNLLLNDAIDVGSYTVINSGATLKLVNPVTITGAYQQSGGGLVAQAASASSYGSLTVIGNATVANAAIVISGSGLATGNSFTIVRATATGSYTGDTASVIGTNGLAAAVRTIGNDLVVTLAVGSPFTATGLAAGGVAVPLGPVLDQINGASAPAPIAFQNTVLVPLVQLPASQQGQAIKQLAPLQNTFPVVYNAAATVLDAVEQHQQTVMAYNAETGEAAGSGTRPGTLWGQILGGTARQDSTAAAAGYHSTDFGLAAGVDHLFTPDLLGGVTVSWLRAWTHGIDSATDQSWRLDSYQLTVYGTWRDGRAFLDGRLGVGWNHFGQHRAIAFLGETASASYDGQQYLADALAGYDLPVGGPGDLTVTPLVGLRWLRANNGSYAESGAGAANLSVGRQTTDSLTQELGVKTSWRVATALGTVAPELTVEWVHDYLHGPIATSGVMGVRPSR